MPQWFALASERHDVGNRQNLWGMTQINEGYSIFDRVFCANSHGPGARVGVRRRHRALTWLRASNSPLPNRHLHPTAPAAISMAPRLKPKPYPR